MQHSIMSSDFKYKIHVESFVCVPVFLKKKTKTRGLVKIKIMSIWDLDLIQPVVTTC